MSHNLSREEALVFEVLRANDPLTIDQLVTMDQLVGKVPEMRWSELFQAVDALSRRGLISLQRRGFEYKVCGRPSSELKPVA